MEKWDLYDGNLNKTSKTINAGKKVPNGYYHLSAEAWFINDKNEVLLTKRNLRTTKYPGCIGKIQEALLLVAKLKKKE